MSDRNKEVKEKKAKHYLREITAKHYKEALEAKERGEKVGWCASNFPQEIATTLGIKVVYPENHAAAVAARGNGQNMCEHAEAMGFSNDVCGYARVNLAVMDIGHSEDQPIPMPDFVLCCNNICNQMIKWYEHIAKTLDIPMILIDIPYNTEDTISQDRIKYIRAQFDNAIKQLEEITGKKWDEDKFEEVMKISQESAKQWLRAASYAKYKPSPFSGFDLFNHMAVAVCARGTQEAADAFRMLADEYEENVKTGKSTYRGEEKQRILFEGIACWPYLRHKLTKLSEYGMNVTATVYAEAFGVIYENTDELMAAYNKVPNSISFENALKMRLNAVTSTNTEGAVIHINRSCKLWSGFLYELGRRLEKETGIPVVSFDGDQADPRNFSEAQYDTRIQGLNEVMVAKKEAE
ncbi:phenyllactyl-CoA dehydratase subunit FldB [Clostridium botulinum]|uniref:phenyllactyl-CoA dehydratase subunit FldB n=1 Tax=Clostridium botulinum TaxID=1491 RepID=UPI0009476CF1|nr:phenyllactyl-CoA dehydratase subunit FldB [Clostridium botulinum]APQ73475.1 2-hydroxyglutaryl-CoA dehydratase, D-component family protein [Clostridium botulinum]NFO69891.1 2-hydroxyacyl-CoA dehydratase [Clostridium botulinum]OSB11532.1 2-hydroxyglutaryl-CoA dehydratase [Clostridium botulinum]